MKTALVTGGTRGIGLSTAQKFIDQGWNVYITSRKEENLEAVLSENSQLKGFVARADDLAAATETCKKIVDETGSCLLYTSPSPRDGLLSRMPSSA